MENGESLREVAAQFRIGGTFREAAPYGDGHINDTYASVVDTATGPRRFIHQRINHHVFRQPTALMDNVTRVTEHLGQRISAAGGNPERETLTVIPTVDGQNYWCSEAGNFWRTYIFIEDARTVNVIEQPQQAFAAARAFARFQKLLTDLPGERLHDTIPDFHHTPRRFARLQEVITADSHDRKATCPRDVEFALSQEGMVGLVIDGMESGDIPERITHNDTKINNVMLDDHTQEGICVIDLDTVMPGSVLFDFGDEIRTSTGHFDESEKDLYKVYIDLELFQSLVRGYLSEAGDFLTPREIELLAFSGRLITFEIGIRFLTDYLEGDVYFKTHYDGQNLDRARTQFKMVQDMEAKADEMDAIVRDCLAR